MKDTGGTTHARALGIGLSVFSRRPGLRLPRWFARGGLTAQSAKQGLSLVVWSGASVFAKPPWAEAGW